MYVMPVDINQNQYLKNCIAPICRKNCGQKGLKMKRITIDQVTTAIAVICFMAAIILMIVAPDTEYASVPIVIALGWYAFSEGWDDEI